MPHTVIDTVQLANDYIAGKIDLKPKQKDALIQRLGQLSGPPADIDSRICFGIHFYDSEEKADYATLITRVQRNTYNGGWYHGMACGRDPSFDYTVAQGHLDQARPDDCLIKYGIKVGTKLYAVTN